MRLADQISRADGFQLLGMHQEAWDILESLPAIDRVEPEVLEIRLRILTEMERWDLGESIAGVLVNSAVNPQKCRQTVATFRHRYARHLCRAGSGDRARAQISLAIEAWKPIRKAIVEDDDLDGIWTG